MGAGWLIAPTKPIFRKYTCGRFPRGRAAEGGFQRVAASTHCGPATGGNSFFQTNDQRVMTVSYTVKGDSFIPGKPPMWSEARLANLSVPNYDLAPNGKRIAAMLARAY